MQEILVYIAFIAAGFFLARKFYLSFISRKKKCNRCSCGKQE